MAKRIRRKLLAIFLAMAMVTSLLPALMLPAMATAADLSGFQIDDSTLDPSESQTYEGLTLTVDDSSGWQEPYAAYNAVVGALAIGSAFDDYGCDFATFETGSAFKVNTLDITTTDFTSNILVYALDSGGNEIPGSEVIEYSVTAGDRKTIDLSANEYYSSVYKLKIVVPDSGFWIYQLDIETAGTPPTVTTGSATGITSSGATLGGTVNANDASTTVSFEYGLTTAYGSSVTAAQSPVTGSTATSVSASITGLTAGTTYHYRLVGTNRDRKSVV
jgi:hypothetical protein